MKLASVEDKSTSSGFRCIFVCKKCFPSAKNVVPATDVPAQYTQCFICGKKEEKNG